MRLKIHFNRLCYDSPAVVIRPRSTTGMPRRAMNSHATLAATTQPRFLMCPPRHFAVTYSINPWMDPKAWADGGSGLHLVVQRQWAGLRRVLSEAGAAIEILPAAQGLPDLVFTANAAVVLGGKAVLTRFRHGERQNEEPVFSAAFRALAARGLVADILELPAALKFEGAGDCIFDCRRGLFWLGCGFRSDAAAAGVLESYFGVPCVTLPLADANFYHLDTAFCALPCGAVIYYPGAFTPAALAAIHDHVVPENRIALEHADAARFAANAVCVGRTVVLSSASSELRGALEARDYAVVETPLDIFQKSGGSACCLTLRLDRALPTAKLGLQRLAAVPSRLRPARTRNARRDRARLSRA
jgi:N-dimethylarginine dimethylaminohydrolase